MSELKVYKPYANRDGDVLIYHKGDGDLMLDDEDEIYLKEDADKVINELEADKLELRKRVNVLEGRLFGLSQSHNVETYTCGILERKIISLERKIEISDKQLRHSNRNRCLAMAKWCDEMMMSCELRGFSIHRIWANRHQWAMRWKYRWLELAEKFKDKEAK